MEKINGNADEKICHCLLILLITTFFYFLQNNKINPKPSTNCTTGNSSNKIYLSMLASLWSSTTFHVKFTRFQLPSCAPFIFLYSMAPLPSSKDFVRKWNKTYTFKFSKNQETLIVLFWTETTIQIHKD